MHITRGPDGHLWLNVVEHSSNSHFPHMTSIDLTNHFKDCVREVLAENERAKENTAAAAGSIKGQY